MFPIQKNCLSTNENGRNIQKMVLNWYWFLGRSLLPGQKYESTDAVKNRTIWRNSGLPYITLLQRKRTFWIKSWINFAKGLHKTGYICFFNLSENKPSLQACAQSCSIAYLFLTVFVMHAGPLFSELAFPHLLQMGGS